MNQMRCPNCGNVSRKYGKSSAGTQRWHCKYCNMSFIKALDDSNKLLTKFLSWLLGKQTQAEMPGGGRTFRRQTAKFWRIWPLPPKIEEAREVLFVDGIYLARNACILICCDEQHVLGWYLCRYERAEAWEALLQRIAVPRMVVTDGGSGFHKVLKHVWRGAKIQRCTFHAFNQVKRYTTRRSQTLAGVELYCLARDLLQVKDKEEAANWIERLGAWKSKHRRFLSELTKDAFGNVRPTHERLLKAETSLVRLVKGNTLFTYLDLSADGERAYPAKSY